MDDDDSLKNINSSLNQKKYVFKRNLPPGVSLNKNKHKRIYSNYSSTIPQNDDNNSNNKNTHFFTPNECLFLGSMVGNDKTAMRALMMMQPNNETQMIIEKPPNHQLSQTAVSDCMDIKSPLLNQSSDCVIYEHSTNTYVPYNPTPNYLPLYSSKDFTPMNCGYALDEMVTCIEHSGKFTGHDMEEMNTMSSKTIAMDYEFETKKKMFCHANNDINDYDDDGDMNNMND